MPSLGSAIYTQLLPVVVVLGAAGCIYPPAPLPGGEKLTRCIRGHGSCFYYRDQSLVMAKVVLVGVAKAGGRLERTGFNIAFFLYVYKQVRHRKSRSAFAPLHRSPLRLHLSAAHHCHHILSGVWAFDFRTYLPACYCKMLNIISQCHCQRLHLLFYLWYIWIINLFAFSVLFFMQVYIQFSLKVLTL